MKRLWVLTSLLFFSMGLFAQLPSSYDCRDVEKVTPAKSQGSCASCPFFGVISAMEAYIRNPIFFDTLTDLAEEAIKECNVFNRTTTCSGGTADMSMSYAIGPGVPFESEVPYYDDPHPESCSGYTPMYRVTGWDHFGGATATQIKQEIYDNGPIIGTLYASFTGFGSWTDTDIEGPPKILINTTTDTCYYSGAEGSNHVVIICGWDDNKDCGGGFTGAWLCKNSYGNAWGDDGYWWQSYDGDAGIGSWMMRITGVEIVDPLQKNYYYDDGSWQSGAQWDSGATTAYGLVKFTAAENLRLTRIQSYSTAYNLTYSVYVYDGFDGTNLGNLLTSDLNTARAKQGFFTHTLTTPVDFSATDTVVIVVKYVYGAWDEGVPLDETDTAYCDIESAKCYVSLTAASGTWTDASTLGTPADVGIRAVTLSTDTIHFAASLSKADIETAISAASSGDTVWLPSGENTNWSGSSTITTANLTIRGAGKTLTILQTLAGGQDAPIFQITGVAGVTVRDLCLRGRHIQVLNPTEVLLRFTYCPTFEVYNCRIEWSSLAGILIRAYPVSGLIHHCDFVDGDKAGLGYGVSLECRTEAEQLSGDPLNYGAASWAAAQAWGTSDGVYVEDCSFDTLRHHIADNSGGRYIARYCTFYANSEFGEDVFDTHGYNPANYLGHKKSEIYNNIITFVAPHPMTYLQILESGDSLIFDNVATGVDVLSNSFWGSCRPPGTYPFIEQGFWYLWNNVINGTSYNTVRNVEAGGCLEYEGYPFWVEDRDFFRYPMPDYAPYTYPFPDALGHELTGGEEEPTNATVTIKGTLRIRGTLRIK